MSVPLRLHQIRDLRAAKVARLTDQVVRAGQALAHAERTAAACVAHYENICRTETDSVEELVAQTKEFTDPAERLAAMNGIMARARAERRRAYTNMVTAQSDVVRLELVRDDLAATLRVAQARLGGVQEICAKHSAIAVRRAEDAEDDEVLETFAGQRGVQR